MKRLVIYVTGLIAEVAAFYFAKDSTYEVVAFANAAEFIKESTFGGKPVVPFETLEKSHPAAANEAFVAIGYTKTNQVRQARFNEARQKGYKLATYISSRAMYYGTPVGANGFILEGNVIQPFVKIGDNVTLWSGNHIGHHSKIGDHTFISSHVGVSGGCEIGENCSLGGNATLRDHIKIGEKCVIGAGALLLADAEPEGVYPGAATGR